MKEKLRVIVEESDTKLGKLFDLVVQFLVVISLLSFSLETLPNLSKNQIFILKLIEIIIITIFSIEYLLRIFVTNKKFKYIFSFYGLIDLLTILPFYLSLTIDLRSLRALRLLRLFRILKLVRFNKAINRFQEALKIAREEIIIFISKSYFELINQDHNKKIIYKIKSNLIDNFIFRFIWLHFI